MPIGRTIVGWCGSAGRLGLQWAAHQLLVTKDGLYSSGQRTPKPAAENYHVAIACTEAISAAMCILMVSHGCCWRNEKREVILRSMMASAVCSCYQYLSLL